MKKTNIILIFVLVIFLGFLIVDTATMQEVVIDVKDTPVDLRLKFTDWSDYIDSKTYGDLVEYSYKGEVFLLEDYEYLRTVNSVYDTDTNKERFYTVAFLMDEQSRPRIPEYATTTRQAWFEQVVVNDRFTPLFLGEAYAALLSTSTSALGDGGLRSQDVTWATARNETTADYDGSGDISAKIQCNTGYTLWHSYWPLYIDIPSGRTVASASLYTWGVTVTDGATDQAYIMLTTTTQASVADLVAADYDAIDVDNITPFSNSSDGDLGDDLSTGQYNETPFNSYGVQYIENNKTGWLRLGGVIGNDYENVACAVNNRYDSYFAEQTGTANDPYLEIQYSDPPVATGTPEQATSTWTDLLENHIASEDITIVTHTEISPTGEITRHIYHIPALWMAYILVLFLFIGSTVMWLFRK